MQELLDLPEGSPLPRLQVGRSCHFGGDSRGLKPLHTPGQRYAQLSSQTGHFLKPLTADVRASGLANPLKATIKCAEFRCEPLGARRITWMHEAVASEDLDIGPPGALVRPRVPPRPIFQIILVV